MKVKFTISVIILTCLCLSTLVISCRTAEADEEALFLIRNYIKETTIALENVQTDLQGWCREPYSDNVPLRYSHQRRQWFEEHKVQITKIMNNYPDGAFPPTEVINQWRVLVIRGEEECLVEGPKLAWALNELHSLSSEALALLQIIISSDGELNMEQSEQVFRLIEKLEEQIKEIKAVILL